MIDIHYYHAKANSGAAAAALGAEAIQRAIAERGSANVVVATGASQFEMLEALVKHDEVDWSRVTGFHLDEYVGIFRQCAGELPALPARAVYRPACRRWAPSISSRATRATSMPRSRASTACSTAIRSM